MSQANYALMLKRRPEMAQEDFRKTYIHHGHMAIPLFIAQGVKYYAQVRQIKSTCPLRGGEY